MINCGGIGTYGTYAVTVESEVSAVNWPEQTQRQRSQSVPEGTSTIQESLPPHSPTNGLGLTDQIQVLGDVKVTKFYGFWGQGSQLVQIPEG